MKYWLAICPVDNLELGLKEKIWGIAERYTKQWELTNEGDIIIFYVMRPVKGIIGYCTVKAKLKDKKLFWKEEIKENKNLWPLRFKFDVKFMLDKNKWETNKIPLPPLSEGITIQRAFQLLKDNVAKKVINSFKS